jgi:membrane protease YdiL (CAAX protease family)
MLNKDGATIAREDRRRAIRELAAYFGLSFVITWGLGGLVIFARPQLEALIGPMGALNHHWLYYLAVTAPAISAVVCSLVFGGAAGLKALGARFLRPVKIIWVAVALLIWPAALTVFALAETALGRGGGIDLHTLWVGAPVMALTTWALVVDPGGLGEETGWRGYAMPRLLKLAPPLWAGMVLGLIWGIWHLPAFFLSDLAQSQFGLGWFLAGTVALSVVMAWLFVHANGNVVVAGVIPHLWWNLAFDAHVFRGDVLQQEVMAIGLLALLLVFRFGPDLGRVRKYCADAATQEDPAPPAR